VTHWPFWQVWPVVHFETHLLLVLSQVRHWLASHGAARQTLPQTLPLAQHVPPMHVWVELLHVDLQLPLVGSQAWHWLASHGAARQICPQTFEQHAPLRHVWPLAHFWPQAPQLLASLLSSTQVPLQQDLPAVQAAPVEPQTHAPLALHESAVPLQAVQDAPPVPHCEAVGGVTQAVPLQQPLGQLVPLQTHWPLTHCWPAAHGPPVVPQTHVPLALHESAVMSQAVHAAPAVPQAAVVGGVTQALPLVQQPFGQLVPSQTQAPCAHRWPVAHGPPVVPHTHAPLLSQVLVSVGSQVVHCAPSVPQDSVVGGVTHAWAVVQHPLAQLVLLQTHAPPTHCCPDAQGPPVLPQTQFPAPSHVSVRVRSQLLQSAPAVPQDDVVGGVTQVVPLQQPVEQLELLQTHWPLTHCCPDAQGPPVVPQTHTPFAHVSATKESQVMQEPPLVPQAVGSFVWHTLLLQQPPAQLALSQVQTPLTHS